MSKKYRNQISQQIKDVERRRHKTHGNEQVTLQADKPVLENQTNACSSTMNMQFVLAIHFNMPTIIGQIIFSAILGKKIASFVSISIL